MSSKDTSLIKQKIIQIIRIKGPSLPVHIAKEVELSILFTSAFLSELLSEKKIKISNLKVGNSPLYFIEGQEYKLENFSQHLKSREKDAFIFLKEKKIIKDEKQEPAIRVALRMIRDFAIPFKREGEIYWRYFKIPESEFKLEKPKIQIQEREKPREEKANNLNIFDKPKKITMKKTSRKKASFQKVNEKFFDKVKEFLNKKSIEILGIEGLSKTDLSLRIKDSGTEKLLVAYNKRRITESDITKAHRRALELKIQYIILSLGEPAKKLSSFIQAIKDLSEIRKLE